MGELHHWLASQHSGLRTYKSFRDKALVLCATDPQHRALYRLLANLAAHYVTAFDGEPLPVKLGDHAFKTLLELVADAESSLGAPAQQQLDTLNKIAAAELF